MTRRTLLATLSLTLVSSLAAAQALKFEVAPDPKLKQLFTVESKTQVETFAGKSDQVSGTIRFDPKRRTGSGRLEIPIKSIDTGIPLRNEHLVGSQWLNAEANPNATFVTTSVKPLGSDRYEVLGKLTLNGVTKSVKAAASVKHLKASAATRGLGAEGGLLQVKVNFPIALADYSIEISPQAKGKVSESVNVQLSVIGRQR